MGSILIPYLFPVSKPRENHGKVIVSCCVLHNIARRAKLADPVMIEEEEVDELHQEVAHDGATRDGMRRRDQLVRDVFERR